MTMELVIPSHEDMTGLMSLRPFGLLSEARQWQTWQAEARGRIGVGFGEGRLERDCWGRKATKKEIVMVVLQL